MKKIILALLLLFPVSTLFADEPKAEITASETKLKPGQFLFVRAEGSKWDGDAFQWVHTFPFALKLKEENDSRLLIVPQVPEGVWFVSVFTSGTVEGKIKQAHKTIVIKAKNPDPKPPEPDPDPKPPEPDPDPQPDSEVLDWLKDIKNPRKSRTIKTLADKYTQLASMIAAGGMTDLSEFEDSLISLNLLTFGPDLDDWYPFLQKLSNKLKEKTNLKDKGVVLAQIAKVLKGIK